MNKVLLSDVKAGMKLAKPVLSNAGVVLINEGTELSDALVARLHKLSVESVYIESKASQAIPKEERLQAIEQAFTRTRNEPYMTTIKKALDRTVETLYSEEGEGP